MSHTNGGFLKFLAVLFIVLAIIMATVSLGLKTGYIAQSPMLSEAFSSILYETTAEKVRHLHYDEIIDLYLEAFIDPDYCARWHAYWLEDGEYDELVVRTDCTLAIANYNTYDSDVEFALYDVNGDGVPELIVYQGLTLLGVFTSDGRKAVEQYLGDATSTQCCFTNDGRILSWGYYGNNNYGLNLYNIDDVGYTDVERYYASTSKKDMALHYSNPDEITWITLSKAQTIIKSLRPYSNENRETQDGFILSNVEYSFKQQLAAAEYIGSASEMAENLNMNINK